MSPEIFSPIVQSLGNREQPSRHGRLVSALHRNSSQMEESLHPQHIITHVGLTVNKLGWQPSFDYCRCRTPGVPACDHSCPGGWSLSDYSRCLVLFCNRTRAWRPVFVFCVFGGGLLRGPYLCVNISVWRFVGEGVCVIIDSSEGLSGCDCFCLAGWRLE